MKHIGVWCLLIILPIISYAGEMEDIHMSASKASNGDRQALQQLYKLSLSTKNKEIQAYLVKAVTLTMLKTGSKGLKNYLKQIQNIENGKNLLFFIESPPIKNNCTSCKELGKQLLDCKKCKTGECLQCEGMGQHKSGRGKNEKIVDCRSCKSSGFCFSCKGQVKISKVCRYCAGTGSRFNKSIFATEEKLSYQVLIHKSASLSKNIDFEVNEQLLKQDETKTAEAKKWLTEHKNKIAAFEAKEKNRIALATGTGQARPMMTKGTKFEEEFENGKSTEKLDQLCREV